MRNLLWTLLSAAAVTTLVGTTVTKHLPALTAWDAAGPFQSRMQAGNLTIAVERGDDSVNGPLYYPTPEIGQTPAGEPGLRPTGLWAPGDTVHRVLRVRNIGTLDAVVDRVWADLRGDERLADQLYVRITTDSAGLQPVVWGPLSAFVAVPQFLPIDGVVLGAGAERELHVFVSLPLATDNTYQGLSVIIDFGLHAEQKGKQPERPPTEKPPVLG